MNTRDTYESGKTINEIATFLYGSDVIQNKIRARALMHYARKKFTAWLREKSGLKDIMYPLFSSKPLGKGEKRKYYLHGTIEELNMIIDRLKAIRKGCNKTIDTIKDYEPLKEKAKELKKVMKFVKVKEEN
jgi:hypothetical protein